MGFHSCQEIVADYLLSLPWPTSYIIHLIYGPQRNSSFCFLESPDVSRDEVEGNIDQDSRENKRNQFPEGLNMKCFIMYLDFPFNNHGKNKKKCFCIRRAGNNCAIVSRSGYIWIRSVARDQESTNHSACFVEWKSRNITIQFYSFFF